jgi:putative SOS response-associated peptidase YedK
MCGRYYRRSDKQHLADAFHLGKLPEDFLLPDWDYNVAPSTFQPVIRANRHSGEPELALMRWGLIPYFAKSLDDYKGISTINAKAETLTKTPTWRVPLQRRRCLVPADGFYEWQKIDAKTKQPFAFMMADEKPFAFAGLWDAWKDEQGNWLQSYSIITTKANELASMAHDRMPVILHPEDYAKWLNRDETQPPPIELLHPYPADEMKAQKVDTGVGNVKNNYPELLKSV